MEDKVKERINLLKNSITLLEAILKNYGIHNELNLLTLFKIELDHISVNFKYAKIITM